MVSITDARESLYAQFYDSFTGVPQSRIYLDNDDRTPSDDLPWVRLTVRHFGGGQESLGDVGSRKYNRTGSVLVQVFVPQGEGGIRTADTLAHEARGLLEGKTLNSNSIRLFDAEIREIGPTEGWFMVVVEARMEYTETK